MRRWILLLFLIAMLPSLSGCFFGQSLFFFDQDAVGKPNLIPNADFEIPSPQDRALPGNWTFISDAMYIDYMDAISWDSKTVYSGSKSLKIENSKQQILIVSDAFPIDNRSAYFNRCYIKSNKSSLGMVAFYFKTFDKIGTKKDNFIGKIKPGKDWQEILLSTGFFKPTVQFARVIISIPMDPDNTYWIDNIGSYHVHTFTR
jgi:hypothetical protein